eukprot:403994-Pelagomonas_calceolata.AAC.3
MPAYANMLSNASKPESYNRVVPQAQQKHAISARLAMSTGCASPTSGVINNMTITVLLCAEQHSHLCAC